MKELALHILDIAKNAVRAGAAHIGIDVSEANGLRTLTISDNGRGMTETFCRMAADPFVTTRRTRSIGMGLPLLKLAAEQTGGSLRIESRQGTAHGTTVTATFCMDSIDCIPVGDLAETFMTLVQGSPGLELSLTYRTAEGEETLDTAVLRSILGDGIPLDTPEVLEWIRKQSLCPRTPPQKQTIETIEK